MLALVAALSAGCELVPLAWGADLSGTWCGSDRELLELRSDGRFSLTQISATYLHELLPENGYVDGYRGSLGAVLSGCMSVALAGSELGMTASAHTIFAVATSKME